MGIKHKQVIAERNRELQSRWKSKLSASSAGLSAEPSKQPSAELSLVSVSGPSLYSDNEYDLDALSVDEIDIPFFWISVQTDFLPSYGRTYIFFHCYIKTTTIKKIEKQQKM